MGEYDVRGPELKKMIKLARKQSIPFGYNPGTGPKDDYFGLDKRKPPKTVGKAALDEGVGKKAAFGTVTVDGKVMSLTCLRVVPSIAKKLKKYLKSEKVSLNVEILDEGGSVLESDIDENLPDESEPTPPAPSAPSEPSEPSAPEMGELTVQLKALAQRIQGLEADVSGPFVKLYKQLAAFLKEGDSARVESGIEKVTQALDKLKAPEGAEEQAQKPPEPPEDGAGEEAEAGPNAAKWIAARDKMEPHVLEALKLNTSKTSKIRAVWAFANEKADGDKPNYAAALKALVPLASLIAEARSETKSEAQVAAEARKEDAGERVDKLKTECDISVARMRPAIEKRLAMKAEGNDKLRQAWMIAQDKAENGEYATALDYLKRINAVLAKPPVEAADKPEPEKLKAKSLMFQDIGAAVKTVAAAKQEIGKFPDTPSGEWATILDGATKALNEIPDTAEDNEIKAAIKDAENKTEGVLADMGAAMAEREIWLKELAVFKERMKILGSHAMHAVEPIAGKIKEITDALAVAETAAKTERKYVAGKKELARLRDLADKAEIYADELSHYTEIAKGRKILFDALPGAAPGGAHQSLVDALAKAKSVWAEAEVHKGAGKFKEGVAKLNEMRTAHEDYVKLHVLHGKYNSRRVQFRTDLDGLLNGLGTLKTKAEAIEGANSSVELGLTKLAAPLETTYTDATVAKIGYRAAHEKMGRDLGILYRILYPRKAAAKNYVTALEKFDKAYAKGPLNLKTHPGIEGIREYVDLMGRDLKGAEEAAKKFKFGLAEKLLKVTEGKWATWDQLGKDYKAYKDKYDVVNPKFDELVKDLDWDSNTFFDAADLADTMNAAADARVAKDYKRAKTELESAEKLIEYVKTLKEKDAKSKEALEGSDDKLGKIDTEFDSAFKVFTDLKGLVTSGDKDNVFQAEVQRAEAEAKKASDVKDQKDADAKQMAKDLQAAIDILKPLVLKGDRAQIYKTTLAKVEQEITDLKALPGDQKPAAKDDWEAMEKLVVEAKEAVKSPDFDFQTGEALMNDALRKGRDARKKAEINPKIKAILDHQYGPVETISDIKGQPSGAANFDKEIKLLSGHVKEIEDHKKAGEYEKAYEVAKESMKLSEPVWDKVQAYEDVVTEYTTKVGPMKVTYNAYDQVVKDERKDKIAALEEAYKKLMLAHDFKGAIRLCFNIKMEIWSCMGHQKTLDPWKAARVTAVAKIKDVDDVKNDAVTDDLDKLNKLLASADATAKEFKYKEACKIVDPIAEQSAALVTTAGLFKAFAESKKTAEQEIAKLNDKDQVKMLKDRVDQKLKNAQSRATEKDYAGAKRLADQIPDDVAKALLVDNKNAALGELSDELTTLDKDDGEAIKKSIAKARELVEQLSTSPDNAFVLPGLIPVNKGLKAAEEKADTDGLAATKLLDAVIASCKTLQTGLWHFDQLKTVAGRAEKRFEPLEENHTGKEHVAEEAAKIKLRIAALTVDAIASGKTEAGFAAAEAIFSDIIRVMALRDGFKEYKDRADLFDARLLVLDKHPHRYAIKDSLDKIRTNLAQAAGDASLDKFPEAKKNLDKVETALLDAEIEVKMRNNEPPDANQLKALMKRDDGMEKLDEIVKGTKTSEGLDEATKRKVIKAAFEARFGCKLVVTNKEMTHWADLEGKGPNLARMYETMSQLPPSDTNVNDSLMEYWTSDQGGGSSFSGASKKVKVREGNTKYSWDYGFGDEYEVGEVDPKCVPKNTDPVEALDWNTIHEVGHAVDDNQKYMEKNGKKLAGWEFHFGDFTPVAKAIAKHYSYDYSYALAYISGNTDPPTPRAPEKVEPETWERNRVRLISHVDDCRASGNPWMSASGAKKLAVKDGGTDRIFHEAYVGRWVSYDASARSEAITGYQFRAPAEWFSELYAAYHCDKLGDLHPAVDWLSKISPKKKPQ
ncbi:hypothetical protein [Parasedimentitalea huanghaiensis]|uniref:Uncharacterized protein n=1 Tax=Parasedimentitalea huanghaiensis TaxID=2682100 RepID=A0A6L6WJB0_9RHOB|nr:hypothetical protein [Zongyanglinia huanghaiensis]MVO17059.1 hypothetical protein [Zongyanglinia huanghaiensis]